MSPLTVISPLGARLAAGLVLAAAVAWAAARAGSLSRGGALAATVVGAAAVAAGWAWGALLIVYFVTSSALSRLGATSKEARTAGTVAKGGRRDAVQVLANGGVFALAALLSLLLPLANGAAPWSALGVGALAASASDTWATEIGTLVGGTPRSVVAFRPVPPGTSGGVTLAGTLAAIAGAAGIALLARLLGWTGGVAAAACVGGVAGSLADTLLGATLQARRWCDRCARSTERPTHDCGQPTRPAGGLGWLDNDAVNAASSAIGGLVSMILVWRWGS